MFGNIKQFFDRRISPEQGLTSKEASDHTLKLATAALLIEIVRADSDVKDEEYQAVTEALRNTFKLPIEETAELIKLAEGDVNEATSLHQFTYLINKEFPIEKKKRIIELLWQVVFSDDEMEKHEEYLVRKIAGLLHVSHKDFIDAKVKVKQSKGLT